MYSFEINELLISKHYCIDSDTYNYICKSDQIEKIKYEPFGDYYEIWTNDNYYWKIKVFKGE